MRDQNEVNLIGRIACTAEVVRQAFKCRTFRVYITEDVVGIQIAGALKELGLPRTEFLTALLTFNLGVEAGQLAVIATAFLLLGWHCANRTWYRSRVVIPISAMIACTSLVWTVQRLHA